MGKEQRDGRLSLSIWVYFGGELYITLSLWVVECICARCNCVVYTTVGCICISMHYTTACCVYLYVPHYYMLGVPKQRNGPVTSAPLTHSREYI